MKRTKFAVAFLVLVTSGVLLTSYLLAAETLPTEPASKKQLSKEQLSKELFPPKTPIDRLSTIWTFGNHEPMSMYKRVGGKTTGGAEGGALWLKDWHNWFDGEDCPKLMQELGLNALHCRFYKGMGWQFESKDFPKVRQYVVNCHKHNIKVLAYVQFATLYYEIMKAEYPDLDDWTARDPDGKMLTYNGRYYRRLPCPNAPQFEDLLKKIVKTALTEGQFDGIMYDNLGVSLSCYCPRCQKLFSEHLAKIPDPENRFGLPTVRYMTPPPSVPFGEVQDPLQQEWIRFRCERMTNLFCRLFIFAKKIKSDALITANTWDYNQVNSCGLAGIEPFDQSKNFDFILSQNLNVPGMERGYLMNRVHELEFCASLKIPILALCDSDGGRSSSDYYLPLVEDAVFGGIPAERTIVKPDREQMYSKKELDFRRPMLEKYRKMLKENRDALSAPSYQPIRILQSADSLMFSRQSWNALFIAEEILLKIHRPYGILPTKSGVPFKIPDDCEVLIVPDQRCLSNEQIDTIIQFANKNGGKHSRVIVTGLSGLYDEFYRQRKVNRFTASLSNRITVKIRNTVVALPKSVTVPWKFVENTGELQQLKKDLDKIWETPILLEAPDSVLMKIRQSGKKWYVHLVNYSGKPLFGLKIRILGDYWSQKSLKLSSHSLEKVTFSAPLDGHSAQILKKSGENYVIPDFRSYALITIE